MQISELKDYMDQMIRLHGDISVYGKANIGDEGIALIREALVMEEMASGEHFMLLSWDWPEDLQRESWLKVVK